MLRTEPSPSAGIDLWEIDSERRAAHLGTLVEDNFYARCPPKIRPRIVYRMADRVEDDESQTATQEENEKKGKGSVEKEKREDPSGAAVYDLEGGKDEEDVRATTRTGKNKKKNKGNKVQYDQSLLKALNTSFFVRFWSAGAHVSRLLICSGPNFVHFS